MIRRASYLVAVVTQWDPGLVVVLFSSQRDVTGPTLETTFVVRPVQGLDGGLRERHGLTTEATHLCFVTKHEEEEKKRQKDMFNPGVLFKQNQKVEESRHGSCYLCSL